MTAENTPENTTSTPSIVKGEEPEVKEAKYPKSLKKACPEGKVFVEFTIATSGKVTNVNMKKVSGHKAMDKEAIRMVEAMPNWKPAQKDGAAITIKITLPIVFKM
ncbi:MAG: energy transducer TonB [Crocinitomicaceae bacterium]|nr:energy transducer TonB [Crocinitomicaceae bacterium]